MTDETTARARAIEAVYPAIRHSSKFHAGHAGDLTGEVVDALLAHPEVLRALAGAPTADVASLRAIAETARRMYAASDAGDQQDAVYASRTLRDLLAAAPEGAPTADVADEMEEHFVEANERLGAALVEIGMALGLPRPSVQNTWGAPEILAKIRGAQPALTDVVDQINRELDPEH